MPSPSKMVEDRQRSANSVASAATHYRARVIEVLTAHLGKEAGQAAATLLDASAAALDKRAKAMTTADEAHNAELADDPTARDTRDAATKALLEKLVKDRALLTGIAGPAYVAQLGFEGTTDDKPERVLGLARTVQKRLKEIPAPASLLPGYELDPKQWAKEYAAPVANLAAALEKIAAEARESDITLVDKERALAAYDDLFSRSATLVSALLEAGGEDKLADRVRPSSRRPGVTKEIDEGGAGDIPAPTPEPVPA